MKDYKKLEGTEPVPRPRFKNSTIVGAIRVTKDNGGWPDVSGERNRV
jgi:hypothetical protein